MAYRSIYCYAWDLAEAGVGSAVGALRARHIDTIKVAASYHAGKFLRPHGSHARVFFPEDGTCYFRPHPERYGAIAPVPSTLVAEHDVLGEVCEHRGVAADAWLVLMHNTRLGSAHPEATVHNAFGDRYPYSLCPASPAAREYAVALCVDVTDSYPVRGITLETPGYLPYVHGFHHEFALVEPNRWLDNLLGLCFCRHCVAGAEIAGIDAEGLRIRTGGAIDAYLGGDLDLPGDMADAAWLADVVQDTDLAGFARWRCDVVTSLIREIRGAVRADATVAVIPTVARPSAGAWYEGSDLRALAEAAGIVEACFYERGPARMRCDVRDVQRRLGGAGRLRGVLRPGYPDLSGPQEVVDAVTALHEAGVEDIAFYNYGHLREASLDWMGAALAAIAS